MGEAAEQREYHTITEIRETLQALSDADWERLRQLARNRCRFRGRGREEDILNEAIRRMLEGRRKWPCGENFFAWASGVMRNLVWQERKKPANVIIDEEVDVADEGRGPFERLNVKEVRDCLFALFKADEDAKLVIEAKLEDMDKDEIVELFDGSETRYDSACRLIRRRIAAHPELKEMLDGK